MYQRYIDQIKFHLQAIEQGLKWNRKSVFKKYFNFLLSLSVCLSSAGYKMFLKSESDDITASYKNCGVIYIEAGEMPNENMNKRKGHVDRYFCGIYFG